ncbi:Hypothetical protein D9617_22g067460 [Elsinoe fawcettii]|nr:Hypothetical protein D9617_22g067460 [Elsinoe fawcettii]
MEAFNKFSAIETAISHGEPGHLVAPSGSWDATLIIKLHYPTFSTSNDMHGEVADNSSACPRLLLQAGFDTQNALWIEAHWRRLAAPTKRTSPVRGLPEDLQKCHQDFTKLCESKSQAKVALVLGKANRDAALKELDPVQFSIESDGKAGVVDVGLVVDGTRITRILVFAYHPEYLFRNPSMETSKTYDYALGLAASIAGIKQFRHGHFSRFAAHLEAKGIRGRQRGDNALHDAIQMIKHTDNLTAPGYGDLSSGMHNWMRRKLDIADEKQMLATMPPSTNAARFVHNAMVTAGGHAKAAKEKAAGRETPSGLDKIRDDNRAKDSAVSRRQEGSEARGLPTVVRVRCAKCGKHEYDDEKPTWIKGTTTYIARRRSCCPTLGCCDKYQTKGTNPTMKKRDVDFIPVLGSIPYKLARNVSSKG